ncbi:aminoglycoside phosphotransferase (APT) family kinase protein [Agromyces cerinus]|uniref:phosphotransferase n=1 Tax=Agromyces cerinus TaxID=33878 RepID=UPI00195E3F65|nr:phosphotransferase [Agromyces cerinus]MBM7830574.1 aminoglycoside phosphotransferase (APT) family kinase protein [Agromyces cerinus]
MNQHVQQRLEWAALPPELTSEIASLLGAPVVEARSQPSGFSSGSADRIRTSDGLRAFVKAAHVDHNAGTTALHRQELAFMRAAPSGLPAPELLGGIELDGWVALIFRDIDGSHPGARLDGSDVHHVLDALHVLPRVRGSMAIDLPNIADEVSADGESWDELVADGAVGHLPEWARANLDRLATASRRAGAAVAGDHLVHFDCRADNMLLDDGGRVWLVDWPWAAIGAPWFDGMSYLLDTRLRGETVDAESVISAHPMFDGVPQGDLDAALAATTGAFFNKARLPAPANMPTLRAFQRREAVAGMEWLRERWAA